MRLRLEVERARLAARRTSTLSSALGPTGTLSCGRFGTAAAATARAALERRRARVERLDFVGALLVGFEQDARVVAGPLRLRDRLARLVALALQRLDPRDERRRRCASSVGQLASSRLARPAPRVRSRSRTVVEVVATESGIEHGAIVAATGRAARSPAIGSSCYGWHPCSHGPQGRVPRRGPRHTLPAGDQGAAQGNAAARRQADHPVRRRGGARVGRRPHHPRHRPRQERHRGSLRRERRARDVPRGARQDGAARGDPQDLESDQRRVRPAGRAARPRATRCS